MNITTRLISIGLIIFGLMISNAVAEKRIALVIGNNKYDNLSKDNQLLSAINDAETVKLALESLGFEVLIGRNLGRDEFEDKIFEFSEKIRPGDIALFFYAGHGVNLSGGNYFLPSDIRPPQSTRKSEERRLIKKSVWEQEIIANMKAAGARVSVAIIDACRNNPLTTNAGRSLGGTRGLQRNISTPQETKGTFSLYSAGYGQQALDRLPDETIGVNSVFTRVFVEKLTLPGMTLRKLAVSIKKDVSEMASNAGHEQDPAYYDGIQGKDPYLSSTPQVSQDPKDNKDTGQTENGRKLAKEYELALWDSVRNSEDPEAIRAYLRKFPNGVFAELAKVKLASLRSILVEQKSAKVRERWTRVEQTNSINQIQEYIDTNPKSPHIDEAKQKLAALKKQKLEEQIRKEKEDEELKRLMEEAKREADIREDALWKSARNSNNVSMIQLYLDTFPAGRYAAEARSKIAALQQINKQNDIETQLWEAVSKLASVSAFQAYLDQYPAGKYASLARVEILRLSSQNSSNSSQTVRPPEHSGQNQVQYDSNGCRMPNGPVAEQARQVVVFYYEELDQGQAQCAINRRINPSRKLKRLIRNFADADIQHTEVTYHSGSYAEVLASGRVRGKGQPWESFRVSVALRFYDSIWRIAKIGYVR